MLYIRWRGCRAEVSVLGRLQAADAPPRAGGARARLHGGDTRQGPGMRRAGTQPRPHPHRARVRRDGGDIARVRPPLHVQQGAPGLGVPLLHGRRRRRRAGVPPLERLQAADPPPEEPAADPHAAAGHRPDGRPARGRRAPAELAHQGGRGRGGRARPARQGGHRHPAARADGLAQRVGQEDRAAPAVAPGDPGHEPGARPAARPRGGRQGAADAAPAHPLDGAPVQEEEHRRVRAAERARELQLGEAPDDVRVPPEPPELHAHPHAGRGRRARPPHPRHAAGHREDARRER
mmetsp:Transcript_96348/g.272801  ORF Transcript_96348/g.272801 Transcript_96348/m.272801 type:complete len:292 (-) Transcript_96348:536-1411(-)